MTFEEDQEVLVRYPLTAEAEHGDRSAWPWLPGWIARECGDNEYEVVVLDERLAVEYEGETIHPVCFRDSSEIQAKDEP
jgi:hypothetical protein